MKKIQEKKFGDLLSESWKEYKTHFKLIFNLFLILAVIPSLVLFLHSETLAFPEEITSLEQLKDIGAVVLGSSFILSLIALVLSLLMTITLISAFLSKKIPEKTLTAIKTGSNYLLKMIGLMIIMTLALIPLFLLLIIPGIIFLVYWIFACYILVGENKGIIESLKASYHIVRGRWWKVLGYLMLMLLVIMGIAIFIAIPGSIIINIIGVILGKGTIFGLARELLDLAVALITTPLATLFMKNFYLELKAKEKDGKQR